MIIPDGYGQVNMIFGGASAPRGAQVVFGVDNSIVTASAAAIAALAVDAWNTQLLGHQSINLTLVSARCKLGPNETGSQAEVASGAVGGANASSLEPQVAVLATKNTARGGRKGRGRMFIPGYEDTTLNSDGTVNSGVFANIQDDLDSWLTAFSDATVPLVLLHNDPADDPDEITSISLQLLGATQRRRLRKVGGRRRITPA